MTDNIIGWLISCAAGVISGVAVCLLYFMARMIAQSDIGYVIAFASGIAIGVAIGIAARYVLH